MRRGGGIPQFDADAPSRARHPAQVIQLPTNLRNQVPRMILGRNDSQTSQILNIDLLDRLSYMNRRPSSYTVLTELENRSKNHDHSNTTITQNTVQATATVHKRIISSEHATPTKMLLFFNKLLDPNPTRPINVAFGRLQKLDMLIISTCRYTMTRLACAL